MITKDGRDLPIESLTKDNYVVPVGEERSCHCIIEVVQFDPKTGKRLSRPRIQKFGKKMFESIVESSLRKQGYNVTILHDPNDWLKEQAAKRAESAKKAAEEKAKAEEDRINALVEKKLAEREKKGSKGSGTDNGDGDGQEKKSKGGRKGKEQTGDGQENNPGDGNNESK